ncbi:TPA: hypothetical protein VPH74_000003 [Streptococcus pyogenes]|nr:hypothetical protein [Streptococcus pyogenes]HEP2246884.1 hypothetical protein [Streptococcus pyogenes]HEP2387597.1 hypothetical protein [Streptococcus pyogenes]HES9194737.1 hypothetical protein [Streptococcus pyogenes]HES9196653.1 hypothetical protein [Streptococcus pyogenes]
MENFQFWLTFATAAIPAAITGLLSFGASWMKNRTDIKSLEKQFNHDVEMARLAHKHELDNLQKQFQKDFEQMKKNHQHELEKIQEAHRLELENIQKHSEAELTNTVTKEFMSILGTAMAPALSKHIEKTDIFNQSQK